MKVYSNVADIFCYTPLIEEAAGTLMRFTVAQQAQYFFRELERGNVIRLAEKLQLMLNGEHRGVYLFKGWKMGKKKLNILRKKYPLEFQRYQYMF